jgi:carboxylesterase
MANSAAGAPAGPFELVGTRDVGVVCIHGFTGTTYEVRYLGEQLHARGYTVAAPLLPGHGTKVADLDATHWSDWADAVEHAFDSMRTRCSRVALVGQSLGGLLALHVAAHRREVAALAALATPLWLEGLSGKVARWAAHTSMRWPRAVPKLYGSDVRDRAVRAENPCYRSVPMQALGELARFMRVVEHELDRVSQPLLVLHGKRDHTAPVACAARISELAHAKRTRILPESFHLIAADLERDIVVEEVAAHLDHFLQPASGDVACAT